MNWLLHAATKPPAMRVAWEEAGRATIINDAPLVFDASQTGSAPWEPKNFDGRFEGPMRLRAALVKSKNLVSVRIIQAITPHYAQDYITRFGFDADRNLKYRVRLDEGSNGPPPPGAKRE